MFPLNIFQKLWLYFGAFLLAFSFEANAWAFNKQNASEIIKNQCSGCHKFEGRGESRFNLKAPDLMWGGSKYKRGWLVAWLQGKEKWFFSRICG